MGLRVIDTQSFANRFLAVVFALNEPLTGLVVQTRHLRRVEGDVIDATTGLVNTPTRDPLDNVLVRHAYLDNMVDVDLGIDHGLRLWKRPRETVEQETVFAIGFANSFLDQTDDYVIRDELSGVHDPLRSHSKRGLCRDGGTQHLAGGNLRDAVFAANVRRLRAFAGTGRSQENESHGVYSKCERITESGCALHR